MHFHIYSVGYFIRCLLFTVLNCEVDSFCLSDCHYSLLACDIGSSGMVSYYELYTIFIFLQMHYKMYGLIATCNELVIGQLSGKVLHADVMRRANLGDSASGGGWRAGSYAAAVKLYC